MTKPACLIINADDYGYSDGVSRGILQAVERGTVTAVGILANSREFDTHTSWLTQYSGLDVGVHLTATCGKPLSSRLSAHMQQVFGVRTFLSNKFHTIYGILAKKIPLELLEEEWDMQIARCVNGGLNVVFVNSHEHIHMLPPIFSMVQKLAIKYKITNIRIASAEWIRPVSVGNLVRNTLLMGLSINIDRHMKENSPTLLGVSCSGNISERYLERRLPGLLSGKSYELMCHPGHCVSGEITDAKLLKYHNWEGELNALCDPCLIRNLKKNNIKLIRFSELSRFIGNSPQEDVLCKAI